METVTSGSQRSLTAHVTPRSQCEKRVMVFPTGAERRRFQRSRGYITQQESVFSLNKTLDSEDCCDSSCQMEVAACVPDARGHAASLLTRLNLQRQQAQFCDCVVRQKESPAQLYPAHRCVLAAASPVLGSVLSSAGALVELQAPCLSSSVLALLLDYVYTGALPCAGAREQCSGLLAAARYLQMDRLQEDLCDWEQTRASAAGKASHSTEREGRPREKTDTCGGEICGAASLEKSVMEATGAQTRSSSRDPCVKEAEPDATKRRKDARTGGLSGGSNDRPAPHLTLQDHTLNISSTTEGYGASRVHADTREDRVRPAGTVKPGTWQNNTGGEMEGTDEGTRSSSSPPASPSSPSPPQPCRGAVPVICHSSRASALQAPASRAGSQASAHSGRATGYELEDLGYRSSTDQASTEDTPCPSQRSCYQSDASSHSDRSVELDPLLSKRQQADRSDRRRVSGSAAAETRSDDVPLPVASDTGSGSYRWDSRPKGEAREERVFPGQCSPASHRDREPGAARYARPQRAAASANGFPSEQHQPDSHEQDPAALVHPPPPCSTQAGLETGGYFDCSTSLDPDKTPDAETSEPLFGFTPPEDGHVSDPACAMGQSYRGHVHYHCIPQDDPPHRRLSPGQSPLRQNGAAGTPEQFLLLDISTRHAELLVSYRDRADQEQQGAEGDRDRTSGTEIKSNESRNDGASVVKARTNVDAECFHSVRRKSKCRGAHVKERHRVAAEDENRAGPRHAASAPARPPAPAHHAFRCSLCERGFSQRGSLNRHVRSHLGVRPFPCPRCPMAFSRQYRVTEHMRVHQRCSLEGGFPHPPAASI